MTSPYYKFSLTLEALSLTATQTINWFENSRETIWWRVSSVSSNIVGELTEGPTFSFGFDPTKPGVYLLEMLTGADTASATTKAKIQLISSDISVEIYSPIETILGSLLPSYDFDWGLVEVIKRKYQTIVGPVIPIEDKSIYDETKYPQPANTLIAYLIVRDFLIQKANAFLLKNADGQGPTSKIITGPTEVDQLDPSKAMAQLLGSGMPYEIFTSQLCYYASIYKIHFLGCSNVVSPMRVFYIGDSSYAWRYIEAPPYETIG